LHRDCRKGAGGSKSGIEGGKRSTCRAVTGTFLRMKSISHFVSLHPQFKVHPGKIEAFKAGFPAFVEPPSCAALSYGHAREKRARREEKPRDRLRNNQPARRLYPS